MIAERKAALLRTGDMSRLSISSMAAKVKTYGKGSRALLNQTSDLHEMFQADLARREMFSYLPF